MILIKLKLYWIKPFSKPFGSLDHWIINSTKKLILKSKCKHIRLNDMSFLLSLTNRYYFSEKNHFLYYLWKQYKKVFLVFGWCNIQIPVKVILCRVMKHNIYCNKFGISSNSMIRLNLILISSLKRAVFKSLLTFLFVNTQLDITADQHFFLKLNKLTKFN